MSLPLDSPLLVTKTQVHLVRRPLVLRPRLFTRLDEGQKRPLTLVAAPAGFGKTTLLSSWLAATGRSVAWVSLDAGDNDPTRFWSYTLAALERVYPGIGASAQATLDAPAGRSEESVLNALINAFDGLAEPACLIWDDYHTVENPLIHAALAYLVNHLPPHVHVILATRADPPLPLARWRARDQLTELRAADLRFTGEEGRHFLMDSMGLELAAPEVAVLEARTAGWVAGLQLAALAVQAQQGEKVAEFITASARSNRFIVDYLVEEVLQGLPDDVQRFLRETAILERLSPDLCDAVTGTASGRSTLDFLERANLFITQSDEGAWHRYHPLFAEVLRKLLGQSGAEAIAELHRRASAWYAANGFLPDAIHHSLLAGDFEQAAVLVEAATRMMLRRGELHTLQAWLDALPAGLLLMRPALAVSKARTLVIAGQAAGAEHYLQAAERLVSSAGDAAASALVGQIAAMRAMIAAHSGDVAGMVEQSRLALERLPEDRAVLRGLSSWIRGVAYAVSGQSVEAARTFGQTLGESQAAGHTLLFSLSTFAFGHLEMTQGKLSLAAELFERAQAHLAREGASSEPIAGLIHLGQGELLRVRNELDSGHRELELGLQLSRRWFGFDTQVQGMVSLAWLQQARGEPEQALATILAAEDQGAGRISNSTRVQLGAHQARLWLLQGNIAAAEMWAELSHPLEEPEPTSLAHLFLGQVPQTTLARLRLAQGRPGEALEILGRLQAQAAKAGWMRNVISHSLLMALAWQQIGEVAQALDILRTTLTLAEPEGYVRTILDEGPAVTRLLGEAARRSAWQNARLGAFVTRLLVASMPEGPAGAADVASWSAPQKLIDPLSPRELDVLLLLAAGLSNREIAERLVVSLGTVKTHVHHMCGKLSAVDRADILVRARALDLIS
jgi:LuxR family transcriptional regulator, maltose regulon positive regulatory protein